MRGSWFGVLLPLLLAAGLGACSSNAVQPGIIYTSGVPSGSGPGPAPSGGPYYGGPQQAASAPVPAPAPAQGSHYGGVPGETGRVVSIHEVTLAGGGNQPGTGTWVGGLLGAAGGATIGAITGNSLGAGIVGALLGAVGGAIAGTIADRNHGYGRRGIEVTVQKDNGQQVTVAQPDDGDVQLGDRVQIVQNRQGVAQVVRDNSRSLD